LAQGFILDGLGVALAGSTDECARIVQAHIRQMAAKKEATVLGTGLSAPVPKAALANGVAGHAMAGGYDESKIAGRLGRPYFMQDPGISIKPYPSGSLSHPAQDLILDLVKKHDLRAGDIEAIEVGTNSNVPNALIYPMPKTALEGKFSIPFCMAIAVLERKAGIAQFVDRKVRDRKVVEMMKKVTLYVDNELEALGYDQVRSRIRIKLKGGKMIEGRYDVARGHPQKPMSWAELGDKFRDCADLVLPRKNAEEVIQFVGRLEQLRSLKPLLRVLSGGKDNSNKKTRRQRQEVKSGAVLASDSKIRSGAGPERCAAAGGGQSQAGVS
jgi:2-methylcitrate dehydratase PrpD